MSQFEMWKNNVVSYFQTYVPNKKRKIQDINEKGVKLLVEFHACEFSVATLQK